MEFLDIIDKSNNIIGTTTKKDAHKKGLRHRIIAVLLRRADGKFLIPIPSSKKLDKGLIHSVAGHVSSGERYKSAAIREIREEIGLSVQENDLKFLKADWYEAEYGDSIIKERFELFLVEYNENMGEITLNDESVDEQWFSKEDLLNILMNASERLSNPLKYICKEILPMF